MTTNIEPTILPDDEKLTTQYKDSENQTNDTDYIDPTAEKKLLWKVDIHVVPPLLILFLLAFLDRVNIGNAKIQGMTTELKMVNQDYNIALLIFFIPCVLVPFIFHFFPFLKDYR